MALWLLVFAFITVRFMKAFHRESSAGTRRASATGLLLWLLVATPASALTGVGGEVRYYNGGALVPDVTVDIIGSGQMSTTTDANGAYVFGDPGSGDW